MKSIFKYLLDTALAFIAIGLLHSSAAAQSHLYRHYKDQPGIVAAYIRNHPIGDYTFNITLIRATTDSAFEALCHEFGFSTKTMSQPYTPMSTNIMLRSRHNPRLAAPKREGSEDLSRASVLFLSPSSRTLCIFHNLRNNERYRAILQYQLTLTAQHQNKTIPTEQ